MRLICLNDECDHNRHNHYLCPEITINSNSKCDNFEYDFIPQDVKNTVDSIK